jgi:uncharacterized protein YukE
MAEIANHYNHAKYCMEKCIGSTNDRQEDHMVRKILSAALMAALVISVPPFTPASGGTTSGDVAQKTEEAWQTIKAYLVEKKKEAVEHGKVLLEKTDEEIAALEAEAADASGDAKTAYQKEIKNLKQKRDVAVEKLDELGNASVDSWDSAKNGFAEAYKALYDAYKEALTKFN